MYLDSIQTLRDLLVDAVKSYHTVEVLLNANGAGFPLIEGVQLNNADILEAFSNREVMAVGAQLHEVSGSEGSFIIHEDKLAIHFWGGEYITVDLDSIRAINLIALSKDKGSKQQVINFDEGVSKDILKGYIDRTIVTFEQ